MRRILKRTVAVPASPLSGPSSPTSPSTTPPSTSTSTPTASSLMLPPYVRVPTPNKDKLDPTDARYSHRANPADKHALSPSRWRSWEFVFYYLVIGVFIPLMAKKAVDISSPDHPGFIKFSSRLTSTSSLGVFNPFIDLSDLQWRSFRSELSTLFFASLFHLALSHAIKHFVSNPFGRIRINAVFSLIFLFALFGCHAVKIIGLLTANYVLARWTRSTSLNPILSWSFNIAILFLNEFYNGYPALDIFPYSGLLSGWWIYWKMSSLRLISFNLDYYWALKLSSVSVNPAPTSPRSRTTTPHPLSSYNPSSYLAYTLYLPLLLAGPIMSFNDFLSQKINPPHISLAYKSKYLLRLVTIIALMEVLSRSMFVIAISKSRDRGVFKDYSPFEIAMVGYWNLNFIWLKLLIIWRYFRAWALWDGMDPVENMNRCMSNNYSVTGFWRNWHCSYNRWLIRYVYIPLGGSKTQHWNIFVVFTFVAIWHDISLSLLAWGWLVSLFILPEVAAHKIFRTSKWRTWPYYRHLCAFGGVLNIFLMMIANLVGFAVGLQGMEEMLSRIFTAEGILFITCSVLGIFSAVQVMFEVRESEKRRGLTVKD